MIGYLSYNQQQVFTKDIDELNTQFTKKTGYFEYDREKQTGLIMYSGAKVDPAAYTYLKDINNANIYLVKSPFNFALFNKNQADKIILANPQIKNWYIAGHSLGGVVANMYADEHPNLINGVILLASYSNRDVSDSKQKYLMFSASNDQILTDLNQHLAKLPKNTKYVQIKGGNHTQFGSYKKQKKDGDSKISSNKQKQIVVDEIKAFIE